MTSIILMIGIASISLLFSVQLDAWRLDVKAAGKLTKAQDADGNSSRANSSHAVVGVILMSSTPLNNTPGVLLNAEPPINSSLLETERRMQTEEVSSSKGSSPSKCCVLKDERFWEQLVNRGRAHGPLIASLPRSWTTTSSTVTDVLRISGLMDAYKAQYKELERRSREENIELEVLRSEIDRAIDELAWKKGGKYGGTGPGTKNGTDWYREDMEELRKLKKAAWNSPEKMLERLVDEFQSNDFMTRDEFQCCHDPGRCTVEVSPIWHRCQRTFVEEEPLHFPKEADAPKIGDKVTYLSTPLDFVYATLYTGMTDESDDWVMKMPDPPYLGQEVFVRKVRASNMIFFGKLTKDAETGRWGPMTCLTEHPNLRGIWRLQERMADPIAREYENQKNMSWWSGDKPPGKEGFLNYQYTLENYQVKCGVSKWVLTVKNGPYYLDRSKHILDRSRHIHGREDVVMFDAQCVRRAKGKKRKCSKPDKPGRCIDCYFGGNAEYHKNQTLRQDVPA